jgi:S-DNA-T family DNA segregation ATPase FtsK/SpoIIIE
VLDDPAAQCRRPLRWSPADGNLAILGALGAGTTTALRSLLVAAMAAGAPGDCHVYVVDAGGDDRLDALLPWPHCGGVLRPHERERLSRLLRRLVDEVVARRAAAGRSAHPPIVLGIDRLPALRTVLDEPLDHRDLDALARVVAEGATVGVVTVFTAERPAAVPAAVLAACPQRWIGRLDDPGDATTCGLPSAQVPPGRARPVRRRRLAAARSGGRSRSGGARRRHGSPRGPGPHRDAAGQAGHPAGRCRRTRR